MKCDRAHEWFSSLIDGSIRPAEKVVLEAHLNACPDCANEVAGLRSVWQAIDAMPQLAPPSTLRATIWQRIEEAGSQTSTNAEPAPRFITRSPRQMWLRGLGFAAAAVLLAALATVSVPGRFRSAAFSGLFERPPASASAGVSVAAQLVTTADGSRLIQVAVAIPGVRQTAAQAVLELVADGNVAHREPITLRGGRAEELIAVPELVDGKLLVRVEWNDPTGKVKTHTVPVLPKQP